jgi:DNA modification methylase
MLVNLGLVHRDGEVITYWEPMIATLRAFGYRLFGWYPWDQGCGLMGDWNGRFAPSHEFVFHFNKAAKTPNKLVPCKSAGLKQHGTGIRGKDGKAKAKSHDGRPIQPFRIPDSVIRINRHMARGPETEHPAVFPIALADWLIRAYTADGQIVLDPFTGSGSSLVAAYRSGRKAIGIEIEEKYCEIAAKRLEQDILPLEASA